MPKRESEISLTVPLGIEDNARFERLRSALEISKGRFASILLRHGLRHAEEALAEAIREVQEQG